VTTGFDLDIAAPGDNSFLEKLCRLKETLPGAVAGRVGMRPSVGVYPLDQAVRKAATDTFTFQKIRRARHLAGLDWYGLHIELHAELRTSKAARSPGYAEALGAALAAAIRTAFGEEYPVQPQIPTREDTACDAGNGLAFKIVPVSDKFDQQLLILLHPADLQALGALDGDRLILCNGGESIQVVAAASQTVRNRHAALPDRLRRQIGLEPRQQVWISRPAAARPSAVASHPAMYMVVSAIHAGHTNQVWLSPGEIERLGLTDSSVLNIMDQPASLQPDPTLPPRALAISSALAQTFTCTIGEVVGISNGQRKGAQRRQ
jgi:hypothetical protein